MNNGPAFPFFYDDEKNEIKNGKEENQNVEIKNKESDKGQGAEHAPHI